ncbi:hypothetical protein M3P05_13230 [Sansalvadorimonas sp. 2012CJ34-2]|uniref:Uncharacterized protein n=1 Tax=Parendozoicomonas callyspongiae TaxID=2942213 RepID=A0ABT0PI15_9GAMM|nr:hypothetical protein [Sansalvadorimonas sp. 2012CJ34-2]MCL6270886.1 hypothetical protein [Sansalvadorimonas sp. 2012CJ34-2]
MDAEIKEDDPMSFKVPAMLCCLMAAPLAMAEVSVYPHSSAQITSVQVYDGKGAAKMAKVEITNQQGRLLGEAVTNKWGWAKIKLEHGAYNVQVHVETASGEKKVVDYMPMIASDRK